ncbi:MAG: 2-hydroxy-3-oxopropionate reductase [Bradyrhizobium sp.]|jgi:2-hydroxy-3-oxopropionate reductase|nr:2-hydroxy-3-oxopropionate reductase [Bradyrhizobium sp.]
MIERNFEAKGRSTTHLKDLENALDAAALLTIDTLPFTSLTADLFRGLLQHSGDLDHSGLFVEVERRNGIGGESRHPPDCAKLRSEARLD